jgi:4-diphosphocytidyl-2-C-methyl-D-erythritol kinase
VSGALRLEAPAKLNLGLTVVGRGEDGLHLLRSHLVLLDVADRLLLMPGCSGLRVDGAASDVPVGAANLAWRGLVAGLGGPPELCCLSVEKRIPVAAGMGGGSSDAAAAWRLGRAWRGVADSAPGAAELASLARIGADVPFFAAAAASAEVGGVGERIVPTDPLDAEVVLLHPPFGLSTAAVFAELRPEEWGSAENDLVGPALRLRPELRDLTRAVERAGATARMTGSGPTLFFLERDPDRADGLAGALERAGMRVTRTRTRRAAASIERISEEE